MPNGNAMIHLIKLRDIASESMRLSDFERAERMLQIEDPRVPPGGLMVAYIGEQLTLDQITTAYAHRCDGLTEAEPSVLRAIRSFPVLPLQSCEVVCAPDEFDAEVALVMRQRMPNLPFAGSLVDGSGRRSALLEKYHLLDGAYVAPRDDATNQSMVIELGGRVSGSEAPLSSGPFPEKVVVTITHAHWANVAGLGIGVGFYM